jgi:hypothetical protein
MVAFLLMGILALLGFLCVSHDIPGIAQSPPSRRPRPDKAVRPRHLRGQAFPCE